MEKKTINEEQFRKLVIREASKFLSEEKSPSIETRKPATKRKVTFDKVESLISEIESMNKSISSIVFSEESSEEIISESFKNDSRRNFDVMTHNSKKNINHASEGEKDKWNRMLKYNIPSDENRWIIKSQN